MSCASRAARSTPHHLCKVGETKSQIFVWLLEKVGSNGLLIDCIRAPEPTLCWVATAHPPTAPHSLTASYRSETCQKPKRSRVLPSERTGEGCRLCAQVVASGRLHITPVASVGFAQQALEADALMVRQGSQLIFFFCCCGIACGMLYNITQQLCCFLMEGCDTETVCRSRDLVMRQHVAFGLGCREILWDACDCVLSPCLIFCGTQLSKVVPFSIH